MLAAERHAAILDHLTRQPAVRVSGLAVALGVSEMTVRRDIDTLEARGALVRVHGGAARLFLDLSGLLPQQAGGRADHPARRVVVSHPSYAHPVEMRLYEYSRPIIAFSTHGEHLSDAAVLPRSEIVAVVPGDLTVLGAPPHAPRDVGGFGAPIGWDGWQIRQWDLS